MPSKYEREQAYVQLRDMSEDLKTLKDTHDEFVRTQEYTQKNPPGPLEVEIDTTALERYSENQALELETISDDIGSMDSSLEYMNDTLDSIEFYSRMGLPILANTCLAIRKGNKHLKNISEMQELACDYLGEIGDQLGNVTEGIDTINENLGYLAEGLETIVDNQERQYELTERIGRAFEEGLLEISQDLNNIYLQQQYQTGVMERGQIQQEQHHKERQKLLQDIFHSEYSRRSQEKFSFAYEEWSIKNYRTALSEIKEALKQQSTHTPSLMLFGDICIQYGQWKKAKDSFYKVQKLSQKRKNALEYEAATIRLANIESLVGNRRQAMNVVQEGIEVYNGLNPKDPNSAALFKKFITLYYKEYRGKEERQKGKEYIEENIEWICRKDSSFWNEIFDTKIYGYDFSVAPESYGPFRKLMDIVPKLRNIYNREITFLYGEGSFKAILVKPDRNPQIEALEQERKERLKNITSNEEFEISSFKNFFNYNSFIFHIVQKIAKLVDKEEFRRNQRLVNELYNAQNIYNILNNEKIKTNNGAKLSSYEEVYDMNQLIANSAEKLEGILERCYEAVPRLDIWEESILQEYFLKRHQYTINHHPLSQIIENFRILKKECEEDYLKKKIELQKDDGKRVQERIDISNTKEIRKPFKNDSFKKFLDYNSFISNIVQEISIPRGKEEFRANPELVNNLYNAQDLYRNLNQRITETEDCTKFASSEEIDSMNQIFANAAEKLDEILENCYKAAPELKL